MDISSPEFRTKFESLKPGMSQDDVAALLGNPTAIEGSTWVYFANRAPHVGEQLMDFEIRFDGSKAKELKIIPGPCATGPAPGLR